MNAVKKQCNNIDISYINPIEKSKINISEMTLEELKETKKEYVTILKMINCRIKEVQPKVKRKKTAWSDNGKTDNSSDALYTREDTNKLVSFFLKKGNLTMATICIFGLNNGNRIGDIIKMPVEMLVDGNGNIKDKVWINEEKNGFSRWLYFNEVTKKVLSYYHSFQTYKRPFDYFFTSNANFKRYEKDELTGETIQKGLSYEATRIAMAEACTMCFENFHLRTHTFRKTACNIIARENSELFKRRMVGDMVARMFLGHVNLSTTEKFYLSMSEQERKNVQLNLNLGLEAWNEYCTKAFCNG